MKNSSGMIKDWLPPIVARAINNRLGDGTRFDDSVNTWDAASSNCTGYHAKDILTKVLASTLKVKQGDAIFERDSVLFYKIEYVWPVLSGLMWAAARNGGALNVLDFGGALGSSYFQHQNILNTLPTVRWNVVEQSHYVEAGQTHIQDEVLRFYPSIIECLSENEPNVIFLSSVLQYLPDPTDILNSLLNVDADVLIIDKTIINHSDSDRVYIQHVPDSIYKASYPCWSLSESKLINTIADYYLLNIDFTSLNFTALRFIGSEFKGYIFQRALS